MFARLCTEERGGPGQGFVWLSLGLGCATSAVARVGGGRAMRESCASYLSACASLLLEGLQRHWGDVLAARALTGPCEVHIFLAHMRERIEDEGVEEAAATGHPVPDPAAAPPWMSDPVAAKLDQGGAVGMATTWWWPGGLR